MSEILARRRVLNATRFSDVAFDVLSEAVSVVDKILLPMSLSRSPKQQFSVIANCT